MPCARPGSLCAARTGAWLALLAVSCQLPSRSFAEPGDPPPAPPAVEAISATLDVERTLLKEDLERHERMTAERSRLGARLTELYGDLDAALRRSDSQVAKATEDLSSKIQEQELARADLVKDERALLDRIQDRLRRIRLLEERMLTLQDRVQEVAGPLAGKWEVVLLPLDQRGLFSLAQSGTLITGTYQLDGGWSGSLQGTLVNRKVHLERIDSKLGRSAEFEGYVSSDGSRIRGTWRSYELSAQEPASGQWSASRRSLSP